LFSCEPLARPSGKGRERRVEEEEEEAEEEEERRKEVSITSIIRE
jgi:hypothetical protein